MGGINKDMCGTKLLAIIVLAYMLWIVFGSVP